MPGAISPQPSPSNFWEFFENPAELSITGSPRKKIKKDLCIKEFLTPVDDSPEFHDPFSDLNLFLAKKIKEQMGQCKEMHHWSSKLQEELLEKIAPEFQKKFPHYRLGVSALKKLWEKISHFSQLIQSEKEAITQEGRLNIHFFIRENLKQFSQFPYPQSLPPYHYAYQLAGKISEYVALIDGTRPKMEQLTKMIWAIQRHLLTGLAASGASSPYDEYDKVDKLIVKIILDITAKDPLVSQKELEYQVRSALSALRDLPSFSSMESIACNVAALLVEKLFPLSSFHFNFSKEAKEALLSFVYRQTSFYKISPHSNEFAEIVRRTIALYRLASQLPKQLSKEEIETAVRALYPYVQLEKPELSQSVFAFIAAELVLMKNEEFCHSIDYVVSAITSAYEETKQLPLIDENQGDILEIVIWKALSEKAGLLEKLPYKIGQRIEEEIATQLIDDPTRHFSSIIHTTVQFFVRAKELSSNTKSEEIERKIHLWSLQGDMLCRSIHLDPETPLLKFLYAEWKKDSQKNVREFLSKACQNYLERFPELSSYAPQLHHRATILFKYLWYSTLADAQESSFHRFLKWHDMHLATLSSSEQKWENLAQVCKHSLPLVPIEKSLYLGIHKQPEKSVSDGVVSH